MFHLTDKIEFDKKKTSLLDSVKFVNLLNPPKKLNIISSVIKNIILSFLWENSEFFILFQQNIWASYSSIGKFFFFISENKRKFNSKEIFYSWHKCLSFESINNLLCEQLDNFYENFEMIPTWYLNIREILTSHPSAFMFYCTRVKQWIWLKYEIKHLPGGVYGTSGLGDIFGFEVTRWETLGTERELGSFGFSISHSCLTHKLWRGVGLTTDLKKVLKWELEK